ncbi:MAG TPA: glycerol kinase [Dehalococcoidia bacterium]|nr:glycerol kinase [Dehalococcoidia bacterium]
MAQDAILAIDAGTTGVTALLVDHDGIVRGRGYREIEQHYQRPGWVEQDPEDIWRSALAASDAALSAAPEYRPVALGLSNQRETMLFWDRRTGEPAYNAIVWQCRRSAAICDELRAAGLEDAVARKTGLRFDPYFSGTKALWLTRELPALAPCIANGDVCFGTVDSWLAYRLTGGDAHITDVTNACRTLAFDIERFDWDDDLLALFGLNRSVMPEIGPSAGVRATTHGAGALTDDLPAASLVGDQQAALYGQCCFEPGLIKATYGTGCFILLHTGETAVRSRHGLLTSVAATTSPGQHRYALEGSIFVAGAALQWCRDNLGIIESAAEGEALMRSVPDAGGVVFVPAFVGLGSPHWGPGVRGALYGLTGATSRAHIVRAAMESMVYQAQDVLAVMAQETGYGVRELRVDGGAAANDLLMQLQAELAGVPVSRPESVESTAMGAAYLAGLAVGFWRDEAELKTLRHESKRFLPGASTTTARDGYARWQAAVAGLLATELPPL